MENGKIVASDLRNLEPNETKFDTVLSRRYDAACRNSQVSAIAEGPRDVVYHRQHVADENRR